VVVPAVAGGYGIETVANDRRYIYTVLRDLDSGYPGYLEGREPDSSSNVYRRRKKHAVYIVYVDRAGRHYSGGGAARGVAGGPAMAM
jgi:hypothetical protein